MKQMKIKLIYVAALWLFSALTTINQGQAQIYVNIAATGANSGASWTDAYNDLQDAIAQAAAGGTPVEIWVARGEYRPTDSLDRTISFNMHSNVAMYGGFVGGETLLSERDWIVNRTVLSGDIGVRFDHTDNTLNVLKAAGVDATAIIDGFIIKHGYADDNTSGNSGGGLYINNQTQVSSPTISNCTFFENFASICGGAIFDNNDNNTLSTTITNCQFLGNRSNKAGAIGITNVSGQMNHVIAGCVFSGNAAASLGGAIWMVNSSIQIKNCSFTLNKNYAITSSLGSPVLKNNIFWKNFTGNFSENLTVNQLNIISGNPVIQNNLIQGGYGASSDNNIDADPMFEMEPSFEGVYPRTSIIPTIKTRKFYENQWTLEGPTMPDKRYFDIYKDIPNNKLYLTGYRIQMIDLNNLVEGRPTSTVYDDLWFSTISQLENSVSDYDNKIYIPTNRDGIYWIDRTTGLSGKIDPFAGEGLVYTNVGEEDLLVDTTNNLLYASVRYNSNTTLYGILEMNLVTGTKNWITRTSSPVAIPDVSSGYYWSQNKLFLDEVENKLYFSSNGGLWWWDRDDNSTGVYDTNGGIPLIAGQPKLPSNQVTHVFLDHEDNKFYMGTHAGLFVWDRNNNTSKVYDKDNSPLIHNLINQIDKNSEQNMIYVACERGGLFTINLNSGEERLYIRDEGSEIFPQMPDTDLSSAYYDTTEKILYNATFNPNGGGWVWDYNDLVPDYGDLRLKAGSPAIDKGVDAEVPGNITTDAAGLPRFEDFATIGTDSVDLGAYERTYSDDEAPPASIPGQALNYIVARTIIKEGVVDDTALDNFSAKDINKSVQYFDGLGRGIQSVIVQGSPDKNDVVTPVVYDAFGRQAYEYLPYVLKAADPSNGSFKTNALQGPTNYSDSEQYLFYQNIGDIANDTAAFALKKFEPSPLNRVVEQGASGGPWQPNSSDENGKTIKFGYLVNGDSVRLWTIDTTTFLPKTTGFYDPGELTLNVTTDEESAETKEYIDKLGRTILKEVENLRDVNGVEWLRTYYVYDDFNNLRFVFPPKAIDVLNHGDFEPLNLDDPILKNLAFQYRYDERQRMIFKKVPGAAPIYMVYDQFDRLVFTQDGNQFDRSEWSFTKYDHLNRPVMTGTMVLTNSWGTDRMAYRNNVEDAIDSYYTTNLSIDPNHRYESFSATDTWGYTDRSYPELTLGTHKILTVTYYDNYDFRADAVLGGSAVNYEFEAELGLLNDDAFTQLKGQVTGSRTKVLGENKYLNTVTYYDDRYRVIQTTTDNYTGGFERVTTEYDFSGRVLRTKQTHRRGEGNFQDLVINQSFTYDHASRLLNTYHRIGSQDSVLLTANNYNEISELVEKNLHATNMASPVYKQSVDYRYNIRGWLTQINDSNLSTADANAGQDYFGMNLYYNEEVPGLNYIMADGSQDPFDTPTQYFQQIMKGVSVKPIISYKKPDVFKPLHILPQNQGKKFGVDYQLFQPINPKLIKAKISADKKPGMGFRYLKPLPARTSGKASPSPVMADKKELIAANDEKDNPLTQYVTETVFLNVDPGTLTASLDETIWVKEDFTKDKALDHKPETAPAPLAEELWLEAECDTRGANWTMVNDGDASNNNYMVVASGTSQLSTPPSSADDHLSFTFNIVNTGNFKVWGRALTTSANDDSFWVRMDGGSWIKWNSIPSGSWQWDDVHDSDNSGTAVTFNLTAGSHTFDIALREVGAKLDKLYISDTGTTPTGTGSAATNCVATAPPADPTGLVADRTSYSYVELAWDANAQIVDDYTLERSVDNTNFTAVATPAGNLLSFRDNTVQAGTGYYYRLRANNHLGNSNFTTSLNVSSLANPGVVTDQLLLHLDARSAGSYPGSGATWFDLSPNANDATLSSYSFDGTDLSFTYVGTQVLTDADVAIAQNQAFSVGFWINPSDNSRPTNVKSSNDYGAFNFSVRSGYPGSIEVGIGNTDATRIARTDLPAGLLENNQDQYFVYTYDNNIASLYKNGEFVYAKDIGAMTTAWSQFKLGYMVGKFNAAQVYDKVLTPDEILHNYFIGYGNTATGVPATPTGLTATALSISQIALSWNDVATDEIYYLVERSTDGVNFSPVKYLPAGTTSYEDQGLNAATTYTYRVVAVNTAGSSGASNTQATATDNLPSINIASDALELYLDAGNTSSFNGAGTGKALNDISGKNNHAMLDDGVTVVGGHLQFSDQGFSATIPALTAGATNFSIGFWMRPTAAGYRYNSVQATSSEFGYGSFFSRNDAVNFRYLTGVTNTNMFDSYSTYILNEWAYFVYTYDNGTARMYKNGVEFNDSPKAQDPVTLDFEGIALKQGYGDFDVLQVYSKTLTGAEVFQNYEIHKNRYFVPTEAPPAPTALAVNQTTQNEIKITWTDNADNEDKYVVELATVETGPFAVLDEVIVNVNNYAHSNLNANQVFYYRVKGENSIGSSAYSNVISAKTLSAATVVPAAPTGLSANVQSYNRISLNWNDVATQEDEYQVERSLDGNTYSLLATLPFNTTSYEDSGLDPNTTYYYRVKALNWIGSSPVSNTVNSTTTSMPDFSVVMDSMKLYLDATLTMSYDGAGVNWFDLSGQGNDAVLDAGVAKENSRLHFTDQGFEAPLPGFLSGITNFSVGFWMRPDAQGYAYNNVSSVNAANLVGVYYAFNEGGTRMVTGVLNNRFGPYNIYELGNWVYMVYTYDNGNGRLYKNGSLLNGPTAQGAVDTDFEAMIFSGGHGDFEILQVYDKTLTDTEVLQNYNADKDRYMSTAAVPAAPTGLAASVISKSQINLSWTENATNEGNYLIEVSTDGGVNYQTLVSLPSATNSFEHAGLPAGQTVYYRVLATNSTGNSSYSNVVNATTYLEEPTTLAGQPHLSYQVDLSWEDVAQNEAGYEIERKLTSGGTYALVHTTAADVAIYADNTLTPETSYDYRIRAVNGTNYSLYSNEITVTTGINPPTSLSLTPVSAAQIDISWVDNTAIETGYVLERSLSSNSGFAEVATLGANVTSYQDNSLLAETTYFYRVKAIDANGSSSYSNTEGASTLPLVISNPNLEYKSDTYHNGNISAITWQTYNSGQEQGYTYVYDPVNRIKSASHVKATGPSSWNTSDAGFNVGNIKYDYNGNITSLNRQARNLAGTYVMDDLDYDYEDNGVSNRLKAVNDASTNKEGFDDGSTGAVDYDYDANGNLAGDANKQIDTIEYNILNLPQRILFTGGNEILYTYDAAGAKLRKEVREDVDGTIIKTVTDYMSGVQYTINEYEAAGETVSRDFVMTPEGRATTEDGLASSTTYNYEYNLTDHLGNVRVTFTTKQETPETYKATFETSLQASEALDFQNYGDAVINNVNLYNNTPDSVVTGATRSQRLSGIQGEVIGLAKSLAVVPGDVIDMEVYAKYLDGPGGGPGLGGILATIAEAFGVSATSTGDGLQAYNAINGLLSVPAYMTLANTKAANGYQVFLNYLLFDKDYNYLDAGYDQMAGTANAVIDPNVAHELMSKSVTIQKPGYIYIYLSNESGQIVETFFDDLKITHTKSPIISADDYYPFGLAINQNSYQRESAVGQRYKYNGKELQPELGLNWHDYGARMYQADLGRFFNIDRFAEDYYDMTPYHYTLNNPIIFVDVNGDSTIVSQALETLRTAPADIIDGFKGLGAAFVSDIAKPIGKFLTPIGEAIDKIVPDGEDDKKNDEIGNDIVNVTILREEGEIDESGLPQANPDAEQVTVDMDKVGQAETILTKKNFKFGTPQKTARGTSGNRSMNDFARSKVDKGNFGATKSAIKQFGKAQKKQNSASGIDTVTTSHGTQFIINNGDTTHVKSSLWKDFYKLRKKN
ncbi:fibronectin type III domain-containing protein [Fulvivirgaceae bacterium BMA12]|uniref:Fibronectin type III domain-containing protein n=1 Tax=Agaribacillus aureus TaxID=3051825 RepID=A0ABT8LKU0_9BACT|nr:fibronectin type III domain-containing protein [Fulvivirgaceae bacterium BMA12]